MADRLPHELPGSDTSSAGVTPSTNNEQTSEYVLKISRLKEKQKITNVKRFLYWHEKMPNMDKEYMVNLNWGSENNPYNVSIVGAVGNQGLCGACWSFVATAATEALVYMSSGMHLRLSEQELIDCDRGFNKGCEGGNPVYAFDYILNWGLTNQANYPYRENGHSRCRRDQYTSKAAIQGYLRLPSGNQAIIKNFVRMSPVATGICGTDPNFLYYTGGLFDPPNCCVTQNHAVLIVGYGHDESVGVDYFIIKNSWGRFWGKKGTCASSYAGAVTLEVKGRAIVLVGKGVMYILGTSTDFVVSLLGQVFQQVAFFCPDTPEVPVSTSRSLAAATTATRRYSMTTVTLMMIRSKGLTLESWPFRTGRY